MQRVCGEYQESMGRVWGKLPECLPGASYILLIGLV